jgi:hypothetical protein
VVADFGQRLRGRSNHDARVADQLRRAPAPTVGAESDPAARWGGVLMGDRRGSVPSPFVLAPTRGRFPIDLWGPEAAHEWAGSARETAATRRDR